MSLARRKLEQRGSRTLPSLPAFLAVNRRRALAPKHTCYLHCLHQTPGPKAAELDEMLAPPDQPAAPAVAGLIPMIRCSSAARMFTTARFSRSMSYLS